MSGRNEIIAIDNCNHAKLVSKLSRLEEKAERVNEINKETESQIKETTKKLELARLAKQMYELVTLEESYADTLEKVVETELDNIPLMSSLQKSMEIRNDRSKVAVKLCTELMRDKIKALDEGII